MTDTIAPRPQGPHPTPEQLARARRGPRTSEAERWLAHAAACAVCTEELLHQEAFDAPEPVAESRLDAAWERFGKAPQLPATSLAPLAPLAPIIPIHRNRPAERLSAIVQPPSPPLPAHSSRSRRAGLVRLGAAAALAAAVVGLGLWNRAPALQPPPLRGAAEQPGIWQPAGLLDAPPAEIRFAAAPDGEPQRVTVFDAGRSYSWTSPPAAGGRVAFPAAEQHKLQPGVDYFWTVLDQENAAARSFRLR